MNKLSGANRHMSACELVKRLSTFEGLPDELLDELAGLCTVKRYAPDQMVADENELLSFIGFVSHGILRLEKLQIDGRVNVVGLLVENDMFGRLFNGPVHFYIAATNDTEICAFPRNPFESLVSKWPELDRLIMLNILNELDAAREWMLILMNYRVTERLAGFLTLLYRRWANIAKMTSPGGDKVTLTIPVSRSDLANFLGTRPESLSRAFHALADEKLISLHTPYEIEIHDISALMELSKSEDFFPPRAINNFRGREG